MFFDVGEVAVSGVGALGDTWEVVEVVGFEAGWELDVFERKEVEVLFGDEPGFVGAVDSGGEEEGFGVLFCKLVADPVGDEVVAAKFFVGGVERAPIGFDVHPGFTGDGDGAVFGIEGSGEGVFG